MANCCCTSYVIAGPESDLKELRALMVKLIEEGKKERRWIGDLMEALGVTEYSGRGEYMMVSDITEGADGPEFDFWTETAWSKMEDLDSAIKKRYPDVLVFYMEEELGCDVFCTNDREGKHFKETIIIDIENEGMEYYTEEAALEKLSEFKGSPVTSWDEAVEYVNALNAEQDEKGEEGHIWLHKAEIE